MDDAAVLNVRPRADNDTVGIPTHDAVVPDRGIGSDLDIADDPAAGRDEGAVVDARRLAVKRQDRDVVHAIRSIE